MVRRDPAIDFRWNGASPGANIPGTNFSARWTRTINFDRGDYQFTAQVDDGVRLYLDSWRIIDAWRDGSARYETGIFRGLGAGAHVITVEYYQAAGDAMIAVWWDKAGQYPDWRGEYFNDIYFQGPPLLVRNDANIDFNWGIDAPDPRVPADNFSVRWTRTLHFDGGDYIFSARTSDGVRVYLDGFTVVNEWHDMPAGEYKVYNGRFYDLGEGNHTVVVEYYERGGIAFAQVWWKEYSGGEIPEE